MAERPIFLVGCPRSGTTLLSTMLHAHPRIAMPPETRFLIPVYWGRAEFGDLRDAENRRRLAQRITDKKAGFPDLGLDRQKVVESIVAAPPTIGSAAATLWREFARSRGKARWGEKRPAYWHEMDVVLRLFPDAQVIHLVRDARACVASLKQVDWWRSGTVHSIGTWMLADAELRRVGRRLGPDSYHRLRYEDLLREPAGRLAKICTFLDEPFDEAMLDYVAAAADIVPGRKTWHDRTRSGLDPARIEAWRTVLDPAEVGLLEFVAGRALRAHGYELSGTGTRPSLAGIARYEHSVWRRRAWMRKNRVADAWQRSRERVPLQYLS